MNSKKLSRLLSISLLFLAVGSFGASMQSYKCGSGKCGSSTKTIKKQDYEKKYDKDKFDTSNGAFEIESFRRSNREYSQEKYERGVIKTH